MDAYSPHDNIERRKDSPLIPNIRELGQRGYDFAQGSIENLQDRAAYAIIGRLAVSNQTDVSNSNHIMLMARGGNYKVVRANLIKAGKANAKEPMPAEQKKLRKRKK